MSTAVSFPGNKTQFNVQSSLFNRLFKRCVTAANNRRKKLPNVAFFSFLGAFAYWQDIGFIMSVRLTERISTTPNGQISMKFRGGDVYEYLARHPKFG